MRTLEETFLDSFFERVDQGELIPIPMRGPMEKTIMKALTIKIPPKLLDEIDRRIDGVRFRSRGHFISCAVADFIDAGAKLQPRKRKGKIE